jgi:tetratricopeptide (TPR) repeat protein
VRTLVKTSGALAVIIAAIIGLYGVLNPQPAPMPDLTRAELSQAKTNEALALQTREQWRESIPVLDAAVKYDPRNCQALYQRGFAEWMVGDKAGARGDFAATLTINPEHKQAHDMLTSLR